MQIHAGSVDPSRRCQVQRLVGLRTRLTTAPSKTRTHPAQHRHRASPADDRRPSMCQPATVFVAASIGPPPSIREPSDQRPGRRARHRPVRDPQRRHQRENAAFVSRWCPVQNWPTAHTNPDPTNRATRSPIRHPRRTVPAFAVQRVGVQRRAGRRPARCNALLAGCRPSSLSYSACEPIQNHARSPAASVASAL